MRMPLKFVLFFFAGWSCAHAQVQPEATGGPRTVSMISNIDYSARYAQSSTFYGGVLGTEITDNFSADLAYTRPSERFPLTLRYGGGYMWTVSGPSLGTGIFQHLYVSQAMVEHRWNFVLTDNVSYTPEAPTSGFAGVPGTGEPSTPPTPSDPLGESILTLNTRVVSNNVNATAGYSLSHATNLTFGAGSQIMRFPDGNGVDSNGLSAHAQLNHRLDVHNSISGQYAFSHFTDNASAYTGGIATSFNTNSITCSDMREWNRHLNTSISAGPEWLNASNSSLVPSTTTVMVNAMANYQFGLETIVVSYNRGINGGAGYLPGGSTDSVNGMFSKIVARELTLSLTGSYMRTAALQKDTGVTDAAYGGAQAARRLGRYLNVFAGYEAIEQSSGLAPQANVLNQLYQVVNFGIGYAPRETRLRP